MVGGQLRCHACGKTFSGYTPLTQHLSAAHGGVNSADAKLTQLAQLTAAGSGGAGKSKHGNVNFADLFTVAPKPAKKGFAVNVAKVVKVGSRVGAATKRWKGMGGSEARAIGQRKATRRISSTYAPSRTHSGSSSNTSECQGKSRHAQGSLAAIPRLNAFPLAGRWSSHSPRASMAEGSIYHLLAVGEKLRQRRAACWRRLERPRGRLQQRGSQRRPSRGEHAPSRHGCAVHQAGSLVLHTPHAACRRSGARLPPARLRRPCPVRKLQACALCTVRASMCRTGGSEVSGEGAGVWVATAVL